MTSEQFWQIIEVSRRNESGLPQEEHLREELLRLRPKEIAGFQEHFDAYVSKACRWDLWGAATIIEGGCSEDAFIEFRYGLVGLGKKVYEEALVNPDSLADVDAHWISNEMLGYMGSLTYKDKTGKDLPVVFHDDGIPVGEQWDFEDDREAAERFPALWQLFGDDLDDEEEYDFLEEEEEPAAMVRMR